MPFNVGVVMLKPYQIMDVAGPIDILNMVTPEYITASNLPVPPNALDVQTFYVSDTLEPVRLTANHHQLPTHTFESCPKLDMLFVPGPPPDYVPPPDLAAFLLRRAAEVDVLMADCSGPCVLAALGLLDGKRATVNKEAIGAMEEAFPKVKWERKERWVVDGKTWTAGGAVAGMDMMVAFLKSERFGLGELAEMPQKLIEFDPRGQFYQ